MYEIEEEIEVLESALSNLTSALEDVAESPYHKYLASNIETDISEIKDRLEELYTMQNSIWSAEMQEANKEYERMVF